MNKIKKLISFDFDDTLVHTPLPQEGKQIWKEKTGEDWPHRGWWSKPESLDTEIFDIPLNKKIHKRYVQAIKDPDNYVILATGRIEPLKNEVYEILGDYGLSFDETHLNPGIDTFEFKSKLFEKLINELEPEEFIMYDDRQEHLIRFVEWAKQIPCKVTIIDAISGEEFKSEEDQNLQEEISRIKTLMKEDIDLETDEQKLFSKFTKKLKEFKEIGFKQVYEEKDLKLIFTLPIKKTRALYYIVQSTNNDCELLFKGIKNTSTFSMLEEKYINANAILTINYEDKNFILEIKNYCDLVYNENIIKNIKEKIKNINKKENGPDVDEVKNIIDFLGDKDEIEKLKKEESDLYVPSKPKELPKDSLNFDAIDGNISIFVDKKFVSDKDPNKLYQFDKEIVTYEPFVLGPFGVKIKLNILDYDNETGVLNMDLKGCEYKACKDENGNPKVINTTLSDLQKKKIFDNILSGYKNNNFSDFEFDRIPKKENEEVRTIKFIPKSKNIESDFVFAGTSDEMVSVDKNIKEHISRIKSIMKG